MAHGGKRIGAGRKPGTSNRVNQEMRELAKGFFERLLDDETEAKFWRYFMTGWTVDGKTGSCIPIPINQVCFNAFKRAVEYKRGMPVQPVASESASGLTFVFDAVRPERPEPDPKQLQ